MPKLTELNATASLSNSDLLAVSTNTAGVAVSNSANVQVLIQTVHATSGSNFASHIKFTVSAEGNTAFTFSGGGAQGSNNEALYLYRGFTYEFDLGSTVNQGNSHLFQIRDAEDGSPFTNGVSNNSSGNTIYFTVPQNLGANIVYQCNVHSSMVGTLVVT